MSQIIFYKIFLKIWIDWPLASGRDGGFNDLGLPGATLLGELEAPYRTTGWTTGSHSTPSWRADCTGWTGLGLVKRAADMSRGPARSAWT